MSASTSSWPSAQPSTSSGGQQHTLLSPHHRASRPPLSTHRSANESTSASTSLRRPKQLHRRRASQPASLAHASSHRRHDIASPLLSENEEWGSTASGSGSGSSDDDDGDSEDDVAAAIRKLRRGSNGGKPDRADNLEYVSRVASRSVRASLVARTRHPCMLTCVAPSPPLLSWICP